MSILIKDNKTGTAFTNLYNSIIFERPLYDPKEPSVWQRVEKLYTCLSEKGILLPPMKESYKPSPQVREVDVFLSECRKVARSVNFIVYLSDSSMNQPLKLDWTPLNDIKYNLLIGNRTSYRLKSKRFLQAYRTALQLKFSLDHKKRTLDKELSPKFHVCLFSYDGVASACQSPQKLHSNQAAPFQGH